MDAERRTEPNPASWDVEVDVAVVGFGGAGACVAIEAARGGASVLVIERCLGGGATALSGGVVYCGGGTEHQQKAGFHDTPENMFRYLKREVGGAVSDETLRRFCEESPAQLRWLEACGVPFDASFCPFKTSYPTDDYYLYYSGSEAADTHRTQATPAPRGHRTKARGRSGKTFFDALRRTALKSGVRVRCQTAAQRLVMDDDGRVIGVECRTMPPRSISSRWHRWLARLSHKTALYVPAMARLTARLLAGSEARHGRTYRVRTRGGVVLAAGGFIFNHDLVRQHAPTYLGGLPLGTIGDDGAGIQLGEHVGGATGRMGNVAAWRFYTPPEAFLEGILVDRHGQRICNEALYGAAVGRHMVEHHEGRAYLIVDAAVWERARAQVPQQTLLFQRLQALYLFRLGRRKARTLAGLGAKIGAPADALERTVAAYNQNAASGEPDPLGKPGKLHTPLTRPPFYALDCSLRNSWLFPCPILTLGGLVVDEQTGRVQRPDGSPIEGLYAAGRNAVGVCSESYVSGLAISDCVFSGRRAGRHAADSLARHPST